MPARNDHKRNLRPYILLFCFFWGLVLGFSSYLYMKTAAQRLELIEVEEEKEKEKQKEELAEKKVEVEQIDPFKKTEEVEKPPEISTVLAKPEVKLIDEKIIAPNFRQAPIIPNPEIEDLPGLTGQTVRRPVKPEQPVVKPLNKNTQKDKQPVKKRRNPFADEGVVLDDFAPPELDE